MLLLLRAPLTGVAVFLNTYCVVDLYVRARIILRLKTRAAIIVLEQFAVVNL